MGYSLPFSKYVVPNMKLKSSEEHNRNSQVESSFEVHNKPNSDMKFGSKLQSQSFEFSSKEEIFFDSYDQAWLESDVEDFQSVASDSTPVNINGTTTPLQDNNSRTSSQSDVLMTTETSLVDAKKQLIELFRDSFTNDVDENKDTKEPTTTTTTNPIGLYIRETTPKRQSIPTKPKSAQTICCLPNLVRSLSSCSSGKKNSFSSGNKKKR